MGDKRVVTSPHHCPMRAAMSKLAVVAGELDADYKHGAQQPDRVALGRLDALLLVHGVMRTGICPYTRTLDAAEYERAYIAMKTLPDTDRADLIAGLRRCVDCGRTLTTDDNLPPPADFYERAGS